MGSIGRTVIGGGGSNIGIDEEQPYITSTAQQADDANDTVFKPTDDSDYHDLYNGRQYYLNQTFGIDTQYALQDYLSDQSTPNSIYSPSQELNNAMEKGLKLTANQQFMVDSLNEGMHNLGYNLNLTHYARVGMIDAIGKATGINITSSNYENMTQSQLNSLVGKSFSIDRFVSTSYNNFKNAPNGGAPFTDKAVQITIKAPAKTQALMPGNGPGGKLGEIILAPKQNYRIVSVKMPGGYGRSGGSSYKKINITVEAY